MKGHCECRTDDQRRCTRNATAGRFFCVECDSGVADCCLIEQSPVALRFDSGKIELDYCDAFPAAMEGIAKVSMSGRYKYELFNFKLGAKSSRESYNCARRHMAAWYNGEDLVPDAHPDAGLEVNHLDAAIWNLCRLRQELVDFPERDNRPHLVLQFPERAQLDAPKKKPA